MNHEMQHTHKAESGSQPSVPSGAGSVRCSETAEEMARVAPVFRVLAEDRHDAAGAAQWRKFEEGLTQRIHGTESRGLVAKLAQWIECWRVTDSAALRAAGYALVVALVAALGFAVWEIAQAVGGDPVAVRVPAAAGWLLFVARRR